MNQEPVTPIPVDGIPGFWGDLRSARASLLALDYDGTLAPFSTVRMEARPLEGVSELIGRIRDRTHGSVVVISGRPMAELEQLLDVHGIMKIGSHGYEFRYPDGTLEVREPTPIQQEGISRARDAVVRKALDPVVETKVAGLALHTRGIPREQARSLERQVMDTWMPLARTYDLAVRRFNGGIELRCPGTDKGSALLEVLSRRPENAFCVYVGDDETDEDAFRVLRGRGIGIRVGGPDTQTHAAGFLADTQAVKRFLKGWADLAPAGA